MKTKRAIRVLRDVAMKFRLLDRMEYEFAHLDESDDAILRMGTRLGLSEKDLQNGTSTVPDKLYKRYSLFSRLADWELRERLVGPYAPYRMLQAIFGEKCQISDIPSSEQEKEAIITSVRARCDQKVLQINELFPDTYPLHLPIWKFWISTMEIRIKTMSRIMSKCQKTLKEM